MSGFVGRDRPRSVGVTSEDDNGFDDAEISDDSADEKASEEDGVILFVCFLLRGAA
jgi:hypothetical protein